MATRRYIDTLTSAGLNGDVERALDALDSLLFEDAEGLDYLIEDDWISSQADLIRMGYGRKWKGRSRTERKG